VLARPLQSEAFRPVLGLEQQREEHGQHANADEGSPLGGSGWRLTVWRLRLEAPVGGSPVESHSGPDYPRKGPDTSRNTHRPLVFCLVSGSIQSRQSTVRECNASSRCLRELPGSLRGLRVPYRAMTSRCLFGRNWTLTKCRRSRASRDPRPCCCCRQTTRALPGGRPAASTAAPVHARRPRGTSAGRDAARCRSERSPARSAATGCPRETPSQRPCDRSTARTSPSSFSGRSWLCPRSTLRWSLPHPTAVVSEANPETMGAGRWQWPCPPSSQCDVERDGRRVARQRWVCGKEDLPDKVLPQLPCLEVAPQLGEPQHAGPVHEIGVVVRQPRRWMALLAVLPLWPCRPTAARRLGR